MSHRVEIKNDRTGKTTKGFVIAPEPDRKCAECGEMAECRPYGAKGADICFECGMKPENRNRSAHNMAIQLFGEPGELQ